MDRRKVQLSFSFRRRCYFIGIGDWFTVIMLVHSSHQEEHRLLRNGSLLSVLNILLHYLTVQKQEGKLIVSLCSFEISHR